MSLKKEKLKSMAADLKSAVTDVKHHGTKIPKAIDDIENVIDELLIEAHLCSE